MQKTDEWFYLELGDAIIAAEKLHKLEQMLLGVFEQANSNKEMQAYYRYQSGSTHCNICVYISAAFQQILLLPNVKKCAAPTFTDLTVLVGQR